MSASPSPVVVAPNSRHGASMWLRSRDIGVAALAVVVIVAPADVRMPVGLPGHRGVIWLATLVATALLVRHRESVIAVGAASTVAAQILNAAPGIGQSARYLAAAALLYLASFIPVVGRRGWFIALAAAPIHLVALLSPTTAGLHRGLIGASLPAASTDKVLFHLAFGLVAGLIGWGVAAGANWLNLVGSARPKQSSGGTEGH